MTPEYIYKVQEKVDNAFTYTGTFSVPEEAIDKLSGSRYLLLEIASGGGVYYTALDKSAAIAKLSSGRHIYNFEKTARILPFQLAAVKQEEKEPETVTLSASLEILLMKCADLEESAGVVSAIEFMKKNLAQMNDTVLKDLAASIHPNAAQYSSLVVRYTIGRWSEEHDGENQEVRQSLQGKTTGTIRNPVD